MPLLEINAVSVRFGGLTAVSDFTLSMDSHELVGLIGPNGAGKTTIFNVLTSVYKPDEGGIRIDGESIAGSKPSAIAAHGVTRTFQNIRLFKDLSVLDNVRIGGHIHDHDSTMSALLGTDRFRKAEDAGEREAFELLEIFALHSRASHRARNLSYGDQRRLEIARALAARPRLLLLDEPAAGLNTGETIELMEKIREIRDRFGLAILLIEHNMELVMGICERVIVLSFGRTIAHGTPDEIRNNPVVIEAYLGEPVEIAGV